MFLIVIVELALFFVPLDIASDLWAVPKPIFDDVLFGDESSFADVVSADVFFAKKFFAANSVSLSAIVFALLLFWRNFFDHGR